MFPISDFSALGLGGMDSAHYAMWLAGADPENAARLAEGRESNSEATDSHAQELHAQELNAVETAATIARSTSLAEQQPGRCFPSPSPSVSAIGRLLHFVWN